jgi:hypothetical protein
VIVDDFTNNYSDHYPVSLDLKWKKWNTNAQRLTQNA